MIKCRKMIEEDCSRIAKGFDEQGWNKPVEQYETYFKEQENGERYVIIAEYNGEFAGYITIVSASSDPEFSSKGIPELVDFNVLIKHRNKGIGSTLMDVAEAYCFEEYDVVGLSVGLLSGYGSAQRMYVKRGYIPTGTGLKYGHKVLDYFEPVQLDDDLVLSFTKCKK